MTNALFVAYRSGGKLDGKWGPVGRLEFADNIYRFCYVQGACDLTDFVPFPGMSDLEAVYESVELFPFFANRLLAKSRPEYQRYLAWSGFDPETTPDPIAVLSVTEGRRATDSFELFPCPTPDADGNYINKFFLHGVQWVSQDAQKRIDDLHSGEQLKIMLDVANDYDSNAVAVRTNDTSSRMLIGYIPRYLARDVQYLCKAKTPDLIEVTVERVNPNAPLQQHLLCKMKAKWPADAEFKPCSRNGFTPLATAASPATR
jgi:hypothetical protein